ncbi:MAG: transposase [Ignavibacteriales bacterium]|nr:transposase [Ignavibacteriales bacterium]
MIGKFKSYSSRKIRNLLVNKDEFEWQKSFYDRIIRNDKELYNIRKYIQENPLRWELEKNNPENLEM